MSVLLLALVLLLSVVLVPLGLPGTWLIAACAFVYDPLAGSHAITPFTMYGVAAVALAAELWELAIARRFTRRFGGSRRAGWGALIGGTVGALIGVPIPLAGPVIGAFVGAFVGALVLEFSRAADHRQATRVATGALLGRVAGAALKVGVACVLAAWVLLDAVT